MYKFLRGASHSQQQMFYQRNHRNLLFFCHPFRTYHSMKTNNNAKCCLLLDNMANKKCILIHSREFRLRHKTSSTAATSDNKKEESAKKMEMDPQELLSKFVYEIPDNHKPSADGKRNLSALHDDLNQVMAKFNKEHAKSGYKIEFADDGVQTIQLYFDKKLNEFDLKEQKIIAKKFRKIMAPPIFTLIFDFIFMLYLIWIFRPRGNMKPEHAQIVAQPPITFEQFLNEYLPSGEIDIIYYYPEQNLLVVLLRPNALIKGEPFIAPGLHVHLDESFRKMPMALTQRIHTEEGLIGLRDSIPIVTGQLDLSSSYKIRYYLGTFSLMILIYVLLIPLVVLGFLKRRFRVVPINSKGTMSKRRNKID